MGTIFQAIEESAINYRPRKGRDNFTGDLDELVASVLPKGACSCRGACNSHIGPCGIKASGEAKICKVCIKAKAQALKQSLKK